ncbi:DNA topoisomerase 3-alpha [Bienertia sinuspersici]
MSQGSVNSTNSKIRCSCGRIAVVRTVRNGSNGGTKFYGCPMWPNTSCQLFVPIDDNNVVEDLQLKLLERDTTIAELEMIQKFNEDKIKELEKEKKSLVDEVETLKTEMWQQKLSSIKQYTNQKNMSMALFIALIVVVVIFMGK